MIVYSFWTQAVECYVTTCWKKVKVKAVNYRCKTLHLRCMQGSWLRQIILNGKIVIERLVHHTVNQNKFYLCIPMNLNSVISFTTQKMKFPIKDFFSTCDQICRKLRIWSHLLKKSLMENFIFAQFF